MGAIYTPETFNALPETEKAAILDAVLARCTKEVAGVFDRRRRHHGKPLPLASDGIEATPGAVGVSRHTSPDDDA